MLFSASSGCKYEDNLIFLPLNELTLEFTSPKGISLDFNKCHTLLSSTILIKSVDELENALIKVIGLFLT
jgi:hypothetical protein